MRQLTCKKFVTATIFGLFATMLLFSSCENEKTVIETVVVRDTVETIVSIISVDEVYAEPDSISQGGTITLAAQLTLGPEAGNITLKWFADAGTLDKSEGDTVVWKAPDDPGAYTVSVHATDGDYIGVGTRRIGVGMYAPTVTPYYLGDVSCMSCHQDQHNKWAETGHSNAWETLQNSGHPQSFCNPCHAVGFEGEIGNSGYDEAPIEKFVNVQCENCHGAASDHIAGAAPDPTKVHVGYEVEQCGKCHDGSHHPFLTEWENSPHNFDSNFFAVTRGSCGGCHEGVAAAIRLSGKSASQPLDVFYGSGTVAERADTSTFAYSNVGCITCHDPHNDENPGQIRTVADVPLVTANGASPVITEGGVGKLCMHCHHARRGPDDQVVNGYSHFGPHANPQADMMLGASAYHGVADASFPWADPSHLSVQNSCKTCHIQTAEYVPGTGAKTGHTFLPSVEACVNCHGQIAEFSDIMALEDFDGDGSVEGVQHEVNGLMDFLEAELFASIVNRGQDTTGYSNDLAHFLGVDTLTTLVEREAGYNWVFIHDDKSHGIHNPDYAVQLLQQSIQHLTGTPVPNAAIMDGTRKVTAQW